MFDIVTTACRRCSAGKLKALAVTRQQASRRSPNVPTMIEQGFPGFEVTAWYMLLGARRDCRRTFSRKLNAEANKALQTPDVRDKLGDARLRIRRRHARRRPMLRALAR